MPTFKFKIQLVDFEVSVHPLRLCAQFVFVYFRGN